MRYLAIDPSGTGTTGLFFTADEPFTIKRAGELDNNGNSTVVEEQLKYLFKEIKSENWEDHSSSIAKLSKTFKPDVIVYESTNYISVMGKDMTSLFKLFGGIKSIQFFLPEIKKIWSIPVDQIKGLHREISKGEKVVENISYKVGRGSGYFFTHPDKRLEKLSIHQLEAYLVYVIYKANERKYFEKLKKTDGK